MIIINFEEESTGQEEGLSETEIRRLREICAQLADCKIPATMVHGDLHLGNVVVNSESCIYIDWSDACFAHTFFDMAFFNDPR